MSQHRYRLATGGVFTVEAGGRLTVTHVSGRPPPGLVIDVSWWANSEAISFLKENALGGLLDEQLVARLLGQRRQSAFLSLALPGKADATSLVDVAHRLLLAAAYPGRLQQKIEADGVCLEREGRSLLRALPVKASQSKYAAGLTVNVYVADETVVLATIAAAVLSGYTSFNLTTLAGHSEEVITADRYGFQNLLQLVGVATPLTDAQNWCGLLPLFARPELVGISEEFTITF